MKFSGFIKILLAAILIAGAYDFGRRHGESALVTDPSSPVGKQVETRSRESMGTAEHVRRNSTVSGLNDLGFMSVDGSREGALIYDPMSPAALAGFRDLPLAAILENENSVDHLYQLTGYLKNLDAENVDEVVAVFEEKTDGSWSGYRDWSLLMNAWSDFDPQGALAYLGGSGNVEGRRRQALAEQVLESWAGKDPAAALDFAQTREVSGTNRRRMINEMMENLSEKDISSAVQLTAMIDDPRTRLEATSEVARNYFDQDPVGARFWAESLGDADMKRRALEQVSLRMVREDPTQAATYALDQFAGEVPWEASREIAEQLGRQDPASGIDFAQQISNDRSRRIAIAETVGEWTRKDPVAAAKWLNQMPASEEMDWAVAAFSRRVVGDDPAAALDWAASIVNEETRNNVMRDINRRIERASRNDN